MRRIRKGYKEFWAELVLIRWKQALAESAELAEAYRREARLLKEALQLFPGQKVLDLGCGTGEHCLALAEQGMDATGIDMSVSHFAGSFSCYELNGYLC